MKYENTKDRQKQAEALFLLTRHLTALGVTQVSMRETPKEAALPYDAQMFVHGMYTGVVEVKCLNYRSDQVEEWGHLAVSQKRMTALRKEFYRKMEVSGTWFWNKEVVLLMRCKDDVCFAINARRVMQVWLECEEAPDDFAKTNHGTEPKDEKYRFIPLRCWERFE